MKQQIPACAECGMIVDANEYHPYAACLMFKSCKDSDVVRSNLESMTFLTNVKQKTFIDNLKDRQETFNNESNVALNQFNKGYFNGKAEVLSQVITALENNAIVLDEEI